MSISIREDLAKLSIIAVEVGNDDRGIQHGNFLKNLAYAWHIADPGNKRMMRDFWNRVCLKYKLFEEYAEAIKKEMPGYLQ